MITPPSPVRTRRRAWAATAVATLVLGGLAPALATPATAADLSAFDAVDPFIGTQLDPNDSGKGNSHYGNTYPGATVPFGMVQSSPTTFRTRDGDAKGGYEYSADTLRGFGMTRLSGTGCEGRFGGFDFPMTPFTGALGADGTLPTNPSTNARDYYLAFNHANEIAEPGYYSVELDNGVDAELTSTTRAAVSSFDFPTGGDSSTLLIDAAGSNNDVSFSDITVDAVSNTVSGTVTAKIVCASGPSYRAHFSTSFDQPIQSFGTWEGATMTAGDATASATSQKHGSGAWLGFADGAEVTATVGLSYVSVGSAALNAITEVAGRGLDAVREEARAAWVAALDTVQAGGGGAAERTKFYTALYHSLLHPNVFDDVDGGYRGYDGEVHQVETGRHFYVNFSGWDTYRSQSQLVALLFPKVGDDVNQSIVDMVEQSGKWTSWPSYNQIQTKMSGDSLQVILGQTDAFGSTDYDREGALASILDSQLLPTDGSNRTDSYQYASLGWIESRNNGAATSRVLEYATDDFAIAQLAQRLGDSAAYETFSVRSQNWMNVFNPVTKEIDARDRAGFQNVTKTSQGAQFEQSTGQQYGYSVPQNMAGLIERMGGREAAETRLDALLTRLDAGAFSNNAYLSNQPSFGLPWVYNWLQAPNKTTDTLYRATEEMYGTTPTGLPGNDDLGSLSSWYVFANLGIMPAIYGTADLAVSAPLFDSVVIDSADSDRTITISAPGASSTNRYTTALAVDGVAQTASWLPESFTQSGGTLDFTMGATPGSWGTGANDVPRSFAEGSDAPNNVGTTPDGRGGLGSLDMTEHSLSREKLAADGAVPGGDVPFAGADVTFTWPDAAPGEPDNYIPRGQRIEMDDVTGTGISFLGLSTNGPSQGDATVVYADGSTQSVAVQLTDWTPGTTYQFNNQPLIELSGRNLRNGSQDTAVAKIFGTEPQAIDATKAVTAVILPTAIDKGIMHVFDVSLVGEKAAPTPGGGTEPGTGSGTPGTPGTPGDPGTAGTVDSGPGAVSSDGVSVAGNGSLAYTGSTVAPFALGGLIILAAGLAMLAIARRGRRQAE